MARGRVGRSGGHARADVMGAERDTQTALRYTDSRKMRQATGAGEGTPYTIDLAAWGSGSDTECVLGLFGNGVTLFSNPNQQ